MSFKDAKIISVSNPPTKVAKAKRRPTRKREKNEDKIVTACIEWFDNTYPKYSSLLFMINNDAFFGWNDETRINIGHRNKRKGLRSGVADHFLMKPVHITFEDGTDTFYHGAFIEFKSPGGKQSPSQEYFEKRCREQGYYYALINPKAKTNEEVVATFERFIKWYLNE